jgi:Ion channel
VYFSFTVLTTTGFGDFTAATHLGRALAVIEMLVGQIYLVTVIGVLVGNLGGPAALGLAAGVSSRQRVPVSARALISATGTASPAERRTVAICRPG